MRSLLMISGAFLITASAAFAETRTYDMTGFEEVEVSAGVTVKVAVGEDFSVVGEATRGDINNLDIIQLDDRLMISRESDGQVWGLIGLFRPDDQFVVTVTMPELTEVESTSGSSVDVIGATNALEKVATTSGSTLSISDGSLGDVYLEATSGASLTVSGTCDTVRAAASSGAALSAKGLTCAIADVDASSGASLTVYADTTAKAKASTGASLSLYGGAEMTEQSVSSGASISVK